MVPTTVKNREQIQILINSTRFGITLLCVEADGKTADVLTADVLTADVSPCWRAHGETEFHLLPNPAKKSIVSTIFRSVQNFSYMTLFFPWNISILSQKLFWKNFYIYIFFPTQFFVNSFFLQTLFPVTLFSMFSSDKLLSSILYILKT